jgi:hypothetical protein
MNQAGAQHDRLPESEHVHQARAVHALYCRRRRQRRGRQCDGECEGVGTARCDSGAQKGKRSLISLSRQHCHHVLLRHRRTGTVLLHHSLHQQASSQGQCVMNSFSRGPFLLWQAAGRKAGRQAGGCNVPGPRFTSAFGHLISSSAPPAHAAIATHSTGNRISLRPSQQLPLKQGGGNRGKYPISLSSIVIARAFYRRQAAHQKRRDFDW